MLKSVRPLSNGKVHLRAEALGPVLVLGAWGSLEAELVLATEETGAGWVVVGGAVVVGPTKMFFKIGHKTSDISSKNLLTVSL